MPRVNERKNESSSSPPKLGRRSRRNAVQLTALLYLREALINQAYESCAEFVAIAKEFGARSADIEALLEDARRLPD